ncbi:hypothetical protein CCACVL1_14776 [Corchorus capsularis]|uniref:Uncharacterized protein n=1 Tax=Corchorus capsularis TaxID=210143 RepID=A0A1R3I5I9_COCAP|nr:hypothetical protein CCACVL1_14776 [Corchorus capsularis]
MVDEGEKTGGESQRVLENNKSIEFIDAKVSKYRQRNTPKEPPHSHSSVSPPRDMGMKQGMRSED